MNKQELLVFLNEMLEQSITSPDISDNDRACYAVCLEKVIDVVTCNLAGDK